MELGESAAGASPPPAPSGGGGGDSSGPSSEQGPAHIVSIEFLDGDNDTLMTGPGRQWVNLAREQRWVDGSHVGNIDRLDRAPRVKVRFSRPGSYQFKVRLLQEGTIDPYEPDERGRNPRFRHTTDERTYTTDSDGTKVIENDFELPVAGRVRWRVRGLDSEDNRAFSQFVEGRRLIYYQIIKMRGVPAATRFGTYEGALERHGLELRRLGVATMRRFANIGTTADKDRMADEARRVYRRVSATRKEPHVITIVFTDHLAVKAANRRFAANVVAGPGNTAVFGIRGRGLREPHTMRDRWLWWNIDDEDWFVSCEFTPQGGDKIDVDPDRCHPIQPGTAQKAKSVRIDLSDLPPGPGTLELRVNWVDRMRAGISFGANLIVIAARVWWRNARRDRQNEAMVHETGHKIGMVAAGRTQPNRHANQYTLHGHVGSHCHTGVGEAADYSDHSSDAECVMFGTIHGDPNFCDLCAVQVKKVDICTGWGRF